MKTSCLRLVLRMFVILACIFNIEVAWAGSLFTGPINSSAGKYPWALTVADFNNDGDLDLAVANNNLDSGTHNHVKVLLGDGDGLFLPPTGYRVGAWPTSVAAGDFNDDGDLDLAVVSVFEPGRDTGTVSVLLGNGDGTFQPRVKYNLNRAPVGVVVADSNGDGKLDLAVTNEAVRGKRGSVGVLLGNGDGTFQAPIRSAASKSPSLIAVGDLNGDGLPDLVVADVCAIDCSSFPTTLYYPTATARSGWHGPTNTQANQSRLRWAISMVTANWTWQRPTWGRRFLFA